MDKEILTCTVCSSEWERIRTRGRKPVMCPDCVQAATPPLEIDYEDEDEDLNPSTPDFVDMSHYAYPPKSKWRCKHCEIRFEICVAMDYAPAHRCSKRAGRFLAFELY